METSHRKTIVLVVDDDPRIVRFVGTSLRLSGFDVITAPGGEEALSLVDSAKPDIMLLDILMIPVNGFDVLKRLRATSRLPVIAMSAQASAATQALALGANAFLSKPFDPDRLIREIRALVSRAN